MCRLYNYETFKVGVINIILVSLLSDSEFITDNNLACVRDRQHNACSENTSFFARRRDGRISDLLLRGRGFGSRSAAITWLLLGWATVCEQVNNLGTGACI